MKKLFFFVKIIVFFSYCSIPYGHDHKEYYVNDAEGYISFYIKVDQVKLEKLRNDLTTGSPDTCYVYYNMRVFKDKTLTYDSISYQCNGKTRLDRKIINNFGKTLRPIIVDTNSTVLAFEPYQCVLQMSLEVGKNPNGKENRIYMGYTKNFKN